MLIKMWNETSSRTHWMNLKMKEGNCTHVAREVRASGVPDPKRNTEIEKKPDQSIYKSPKKSSC